MQRKSAQAAGKALGRPPATRRSTAKARKRGGGGVLKGGGRSLISTVESINARSDTRLLQTNTHRAKHKYHRQPLDDKDQRRGYSDLPLHRECSSFEKSEKKTG